LNFENRDYLRWLLQTHDGENWGGIVAQKHDLQAEAMVVEL
jgi:hypothetical protein